MEPSTLELQKPDRLYPKHDQANPNPTTPLEDQYIKLSSLTDRKAKERFADETSTPFSTGLKSRFNTLSSGFWVQTEMCKLCIYTQVNRLCSRPAVDSKRKTRVNTQILQWEWMTR